MIGARYQDRYFGFWSQSESDRGGVIFDVTEGRPSLIPLTTVATGAWTDPETGKLYLVVGGKIVQWNAHASNRLIAEWRSSVAPQPRPVNPGYARVTADLTDLNDTSGADRLAYYQGLNTTLLAGTDPAHPGDPLTGAVIGGAMIGEEMLGGSALYENLEAEQTRYCQFRLYADGVLKHEEVVDSDEPFSLPSGYDAREIAVGIVTTVKVKAVEMGESAEDLQEMAP